MSGLAHFGTNAHLNGLTYFDDRVHVSDLY